MIEYNLRDFIARSTDKKLEESDLWNALEVLPPLSASGPFLAGGALRRLLTGGDSLSSDLDFFFTNADQRAKFEADILGIDDAKEVKRTDHHAEFSVFVEKIEKRITIQAIHFQDYASPAAVIDSFDFTICQMVFDGEKLYVGDHTLWDLARKRLALHRVTFGLSTVRRLLKYQKQGFYACAGCLTAILNEVVADPSKVASKIQYVD